MLPPFILFDLDDTLFDHQRATHIALRAIHAAHAGDLPFDKFASEHARVLEVYHQRFLRGELSLDEARAARMIEAFATFDRPLSIDESLTIADTYRREHRGNRALVDGARELLDALHGKARLGLISNNAVAEQFAKLRELDIARYFEAIVISEDVGVAKPDAKIFALALERLGASARQTVMVGDSLHADVQGARNAGIGAVWLNRGPANKAQENIQTLALAGVSGEKCLESRANAGVSTFKPIEIAALSPTSVALAAIQSAYQENITALKDFTNAKLETLAS